MLKFFDKLEDKVRQRLSRHPIWYGLIGGVGVVLFWRGVWHTADYLMLRYIYLPLNGGAGGSSTDLSSGVWWDGPLSLVMGTALLLIIGLFVSSFIGSEIIISGLRGEKKISEKTERQVKSEARAIAGIRREIKNMSQRIDQLK